MPIVVAILGVVIVVLGFVFFAVNPATEPAVVETTEMNRTEEMEKASEAVVEDTTAASPTVSKDDVVAEVAMSQTLTGTGSYLTPARTPHEMDVTITLTNGLVSDVNVVYDNGEGFTDPNQERFAAVYKKEVIGKSLDEISLSRVGGASLTTEGFNKALAAIKAQQS